MFQLALLLSAMLHALVFLTVSFHYVIRPAPMRAPLRSYRIDDAMQAYDIQPVMVPAGQPEPLPLPRREPIPSTPIPPLPQRVAPAVAPAAGPAPPSRVPSAAERLRQGYGDPQLLVPPDRVAPPELTEGEYLRYRLAEKAGVYNDSVAAEAAAKLRATDWTVKDKNGDRWGVTPGQIHLGKVTLPLPFGFSPSGQRGVEAREAMRDWAESQAQAARVEAAQTFEQRVKAIREKQQAQRDSTKKKGGGG